MTPSVSGDIEFQAVSWIGYDHISDDDTTSNDEDSFGSAPLAGEYRIDIFGKSADGRSVCVHVPFNPYFFVELPNGFTDMHVQTKVMTYLKDRMRGKKLDKHVMAFKTVKRKKFYGFTNNKEFTFACIIFKSIQACSYAASILRKTYTIYENNVDPVLRLMHIRDLRSAGWIRVGNHTTSLDKITRCDIEVTANNKEIFPVDREEIGPLVMASFDIECISADGAFPNPADKGSPIIQIATCFQRYGEKEPYQRHIVCLGDTSPIDGVDMFSTESETELLLKWSEQLIANKVDVLIGYNIWGFDMEYVYERARFHGGIHNHDIRKFLHNHGKYRFKTTELQTMTLSSSAYGNNEWRTMRSPGILQIDLMQVIKKEYKLDSYKLDSVAEHFVGDRKVDLPIHEMFKLYRMGGAEEKRKIAEYCVKDTELPLKLAYKLAVLPNMVEMAKATHVPLDFLIPRGQQIKVFSQILKKTREKGYVCPSIPLIKKDVKYEGATVLDAKTGAHWGVITCLDFASLYPSIMRAHNMCHSTIVIDKAFDNVPGIEYYEVDGYRFAQASEGILPEILRDLATFRKKAKKDMAAAKNRNDNFSEMLFNGKQLAFKVSMNSMYGFCGAANGFLPCIPIASCVTNVGRQMISKTKSMIEEQYTGSSVVYGDTDSVMIDFGVDDLHKCFQLGEEAAQMVTKTFQDPIELTFEKCYRPYLLFAKKRYAGLYYTNPDKPDKLDCKGIQLVRRDNCKLVKRVLEKVLNLIMYERNLEGAVKYVKDTATDLLAGRIHYSELVLSKTLKASAVCLKNQRAMVCQKCNASLSRVGEDILACGSCGHKERLVYKNATQPHIVVACKIEERSPGSGPNAGERVPYLYVDHCDKALKASTQTSLQAEDVTHVLDNKLAIDYWFYLEHQLKKPVIDLMDIVMKDCESKLFTDIGESEYLSVRSEKVRTKQNSNNKQREITSFFKKT